MALIGTNPVKAGALGVDAAGEAADESNFPTAEALRAQAIHRLQVGLAGLFAMVLLVGLANVIMERAREADRQVAQTPAGEEAAAAQAVASSTAKSGSDPLADIGAVPELPSTSPSARAGRNSPAN